LTADYAYGTDLKEMEEGTMSFLIRAGLCIESTRAKTG